MDDLTALKKDFLTGCYLREGLVPYMRKMGAEFKAYKSPFSVLLIDVDHFKSLNDKYGHLYGDEVLKYFASSLRLGFGDVSNMPFRYGGDEFVIIFPGKNSKEACSLGNGLERTVKARSFLFKGKQFKMSFSGGVASYPADGKTMEEILDKADKAMYYSKRHGHGRCVEYCMIFLENVKIAAKFAGFALLLLLVFFFMKYRFNESLTFILNKMQAVQIKVESSQAFDTVYLKSGGVFKGEIVNESPQSIDLKLKFESGEGLVVIEKSKISRIKRGAQEK